MCYYVKIYLVTNVCDLHYRRYRLRNKSESIIQLGFQIESRAL